MMGAAPSRLIKILSGCQLAAAQQLSKLIEATDSCLQLDRLQQGTVQHNDSLNFLVAWVYTDKGHHLVALWLLIDSGNTLQ